MAARSKLKLNNFYYFIARFVLFFAFSNNKNQTQKSRIYYSIESNTNANIKNYPFKSQIFKFCNTHCWPSYSSTLFSSIPIIFCAITLGKSQNDKFKKKDCNCRSQCSACSGNLCCKKIVQIWRSYNIVVLGDRICRIGWRIQTRFNTIN